MTHPITDPMTSAQVPARARLASLNVNSGLGLLLMYALIVV
jgi:hypothetical protein